MHLVKDKIFWNWIAGVDSILPVIRDGIINALLICILYNKF